MLALSRHRARRREQGRPRAQWARWSPCRRGFNYSEANKNSGLVWNEATFKDYIRSPQAKIPGTKMAFAGITNPQEIEDLWAYLKQFDAKGEVKK
jgi:cytochrome c